MVKISKSIAETALLNGLTLESGYWMISTSLSIRFHVHCQRAYPSPRSKSRQDSTPNHHATVGSLNVYRARQRGIVRFTTSPGETTQCSTRKSARPRDGDKRGDSYPPPPLSNNNHISELQKHELFKTHDQQSAEGKDRKRCREIAKWLAQTIVKCEWLGNAGPIFPTLSLGQRERGCCCLETRLKLASLQAPSGSHFPPAPYFFFFFCFSFCFFSSYSRPTSTALEDQVHDRPISHVAGPRLRESN